MNTQTKTSSSQELIADLTKMWQIRIFEESLQVLYQEGAIHGTLHFCSGQEATAVGGAGLLTKQDWLVSTHRNHGHSIAKGTNRREMFAEILGKKTGTNHGKGGSMHISDGKVGNLNANGIVGGGFPIAAGAALTARMQGTDQVVLCYAGDGATNEGSFHEALNLAAVWQLPVIYLIENNQYGMSSSIQHMVNIEHLSKRADSYGMEGITIDGNDILTVKQTVKQALTKARAGYGPTLIEALTYRHHGHSKSDQLLYRSQEESQFWKTKDPILRLATYLLEQQFLTKSDLQQLEQQVRKETEALIADVKKDPEPIATDLWLDVYAEENQ
ncbi:thiamine pyrophosphate-dependent dehydrogenase E1 component subunit alpha [Enterococcus faecalis]